ncbi:MAG: rpe, Ribulose-phosphate 3-epimerase [Candidatus Saccharibacteria bacterium]|jgi:ribulose-phosphate 3-epimerase|nr:rpe, Ribulose-phosphate 3-epimerase [Candidatus Saccharibacteria bacterium]
MASVAPTINATTPEDYARRIDNVKPFASRIHVDVGDGVFTDVKTVGLAQVYDIDGVPMDLHLMMTHPEGQIENIIALQPSLVIVHFEAPFDRDSFFRELRSMEIRVGLAINVETTIEQAKDAIPNVDHLVVFTGRLGHNGGEFRVDCLEKIAAARAINPGLEIAVDGGLNQETSRLAIEAGADLLDVGSFIHDAADPEIAYVAVEAIAQGAS